MPTERSFDGHPTVRRGRRTLSLWALREDVLVDTGCPSGAVVLSGRWGEVRMRHASPSVREALRRMRLGPISLANVVAGAPPPPPPAGGGGGGGGGRRGG
ncbi:goadsporin biosynthetic protein, partial [Streptomyces sp. NPDC059131]